MSTEGSLLRVDGVTKRFGRVTVLNEVELTVGAGEIHALLGANGAGKSTLVKILAGLLPATAGQMMLAGTSYRPTSKQAAEQSGVQIVQQELNLFPTLSIAENLFLNRLPSWGAVLHRRRLYAWTRRALTRVGLEHLAPDLPAAQLGIGQQQLIEIAAALDRECRVLILDEPTAALSQGEAEVLFKWLKRLREAGVAIIYISHRLDEVRQLADRVTILRDGRRVGSFAADELAADTIIEHMTGDASQSAESTHCSYEQTQDALRVAGLCSGFVRDVSFTVKHGERLGITGLVGAGRSELLRAIFGADRAEAGKVMVGAAGSPRLFRHPHEAVRAGLAMITEDRKQNGLLLPLSVRSNMSLAALWRRFSKGFLVRGAAEAWAAQEKREELEIRTTGLEQTVGALSGGNQQKVAVAKWLLCDAEVYLFDEPTRGIDVGARRRLYRLFESLARRGKGLVIVSSDVDELLETCDRIAVMSQGRLVETFTRPDWSSERIMQAAFAAHRTKDVS